jgi:hypothetical protein
MNNYSSSHPATSEILNYSSSNIFLKSACSYQILYFCQNFCKLWCVQGLVPEERGGGVQNPFWKITGTGLILDE